MFTFPYRKTDDGSPFPLAIVPIELHSITGDRALEGAGTIDTGAALSMFPLDLMPRLGISHGQCHERKASGVGGGVSTLWEYPPGIEAHICGHRVRLAARFTDITAWHGALLGREDFMRAFAVDFAQREYRIHLKPYPDTPRIGEGGPLAAPRSSWSVTPRCLGTPPELLAALGEAGVEVVDGVPGRWVAG